MPSNKNQHFVPRCHLRPFSHRENDAAISLYNIDRESFISTAAIKHQCSGDYFYGNDESLENAIQAVEGPYGAAVREIQSPGYKLTDFHRTVLRTFWLMQNLRTESAAKRAVELSNSIKTTVGQEEPDFDLEIREAVQMAMMMFARQINAVSDLKVCLVRNKTDTPFIASDNPAIITNRWHLHNKKRCGLSFGLKSSGLIAFLPINPDILCVGYDGDVYSIPHTDGWVVAHNEADIDAFNQHQYLNCNSNVYVHNQRYEQQIDSAFKHVKGVRPESTHRINYAVTDITQDGYTRYKVVNRGRTDDDSEALVHTQRIYPEPTRWPLQISWRRKGAVFTNGSGVGYVRRAWVNELGESPFWKEKA